MPQLNPSPWLKFFLLSWMVFIIPMAVISMGTYTSAPSSTMAKKASTFWSWTWT
uniref:ATP synthase complex subunit 8 n=1 Tax=Porichthys myriaster TaxID=262771 RepID=Q5GM90_9TELE|nr:ATPase subunit 8 [Porichthys myriaster]